MHTKHTLYTHNANVAILRLRDDDNDDGSSSSTTSSSIGVTEEQTMDTQRPILMAT